LRRITVLLAAAIFMSLPLLAQTPDAKPVPDVLVFANGDQLTGQLVSAAGGNIVFKSDMAGSITVGFDKIKELRSGTKAAQFALIQKNVKVTHGTPAPEGTVSVADGQVHVAIDQPAANASSSSVPATIPVANVSLLVPKAEFDKQVHGHDNFFSDWNGTVTGGATVARSTTSATTLTAGIALIRATPTVAWLPPRDRTTVDVVESYGKNTSPTNIPPIPDQPNPEIITLSSIFHADAERDQYIKPKFYALGDTSFDHNYAQGLSLQQVYGGGFGWTVKKDAKQELDLKVDLHYETQKYLGGEINGAVVATQPSTHLIGSTVFESYTRTLPRKMIFTEVFNALPAFNDANAYSANGTIGLTLPLVKRLSANISTTDNFLNDPAIGFKKNSYQFVTGVTYTLR
jgi:hypothetical protein